MVARADYRFFFPFRVRYSEVDQQGVVFNACYLVYFDTALTEYMRALPYDYAAHVQGTGADFHTVRSVVDYKSPIHFDDEIEVGVRVGRIGRSSITFALAIFPKGQDTLLASGEIVWVNTDQAARKAVPVPQDLRDAVVRREGAQVAAG
ncbi:MAG: acyl-CoA thioesterase [Bradyrhizobiaceae bacterium]|nr:acyl-CoA thioesterase [Bradyrhizobiaceae bacterium]